jgi:hypothetical protein
MPISKWGILDWVNSIGSVAGIISLTVLISHWLRHIMHKPALEVTLCSGPDHSTLDCIDWWLSVKSMRAKGLTKAIGKDAARVAATLELSKVQSNEVYPKLVGDWSKNTVSNRAEIEPGDTVRLNLIDKGKGGQLTVWGSYVYGLGFCIPVTELGEYRLTVNLSVALGKVKTYCFHIICDSERLIVTQTC